MSLDMVMMALVVAGIALSITYFYVAMRLWRQYARREREKASAQRKLHAEHGAAPAPPCAVSRPQSGRQIAA